jgi:hypothetical protein
MESGEHKIVGDATPLRGLGTETLVVQGLDLTYGHIVALGGDYYGVPSEPICLGATGAERQKRFANAVATLTSSTSVFGKSIGQAELAAVVALIDHEVQALAPAVAKPTPTGASDIYKALASSNFWPALYTGGTYLQLAGTNFDHFGMHAQMAYVIGHRTAIVMAVAAHDRRPFLPGVPVPTLSDAYITNAFADHFLTDLFSAGHLRTPRTALHNWSQVGIPGFGDAGDVLSWYCHDEDYKYGLNVSNGKTSWFMYGDKRIFDSVNASGLALAEQAVQASKQEVYAAYQTGIDPFAAISMDAQPAQVPAAALAVTPDPAKASYPGTNPDHQVLFRFVSGDSALEERKDVNELACADYVGCNSSVFTYTDLKARYSL